METLSPFPRAVIFLRHSWELRVPILLCSGFFCSSHSEHTLVLVLPVTYEEQHVACQIQSLGGMQSAEGTQEIQIWIRYIGSLDHQLQLMANLYNLSDSQILHSGPSHVNLNLQSPVWIRWRTLQVTGCCFSFPYKVLQECFLAHLLRTNLQRLTVCFFRTETMTPLFSKSKRNEYRDL